MMLQEILFRSASLLGIVSIVTAFVVETLQEFTSSIMIYALLFLVLEAIGFVILAVVQIWKFFSRKRSAMP